MAWRWLARKRIGQAGADKTEVVRPDSLAPAACFAIILSALNRLRWSLFFITNLRRMILFPV